MTYAAEIRMVHASSVDHVPIHAYGVNLSLHFIFIYHRALNGAADRTRIKRSHPMSHLLGCDMGHLLISRKFAPRGPVYPGQIPPGVPATRAGRQYIH